MNKEDLTAVIHSTESFGTVDGPGIRFIVFFQGCPLQCIYCHNRDSWDKKDGKEVPLSFLVDKIALYKEYMKGSGGGVTASGGEPLLQPDAVEALFVKVKSLGLNTVLDTSGSLPLTDKVQRVLDQTDLVLFDIKHIREEGFRSITGSSSRNNRLFLKDLEKRNLPVWLRYVVIPGYTDDFEDIRQTALFLKQYSCVKRIDLLPYHDMGQAKWALQGQTYPLEGVLPPSEDSMKTIKKLFKESGIKVV